MPKFSSLDLNEISGKFDPTVDTEADLAFALDSVFQNVAFDLGLGETAIMSDSAFVDFARDRMSDHQVPRDMIDRAAAWIRRDGRLPRFNQKQDFKF